MSSGKTIKMALIATYPHLSKLLKRLAAANGVDLLDIYASFEDAVEQARQVRNKVDIIISKGGTAEYIRRAIDLPVVSIPSTPYDVVSTIFQAGISDQEIALVVFHKNIHDTASIARMFNLTIHEYTFIDQWDIMEAVRDAKAKGIQTILGGFLTASYAQSLGLRGIDLAPCEDSVERGFFEAVRLVHAQWEERTVAKRLRVAMNSLQEGVIITNENHTITHVNTAAENLLNIRADQVEHLDINSAIPFINYPSSESSISDTQNSLKTFGKATVVLNHYPVHLDKNFIGIVSTFEDITKIQNLEKSIRKTLFSKGFLAKYQFEDILTQDPQMARIKSLAEIYAKTSSSVLIEGESGTGKEMLAQSIHLSSPCAHGPFVAINCAAIPDQLLEAELFGYEAGAFTGAKREGKPGMFELAHGGTIFLDEIGELPLSLQASLLRVVQEREIMRIGGNRLIPVSTRIISATNRNLAEKVEAGEFRRDLYYRLGVFTLKVPSLRERKRDIPLLSQSFMESRGLTDPDHLQLVKDILKRMSDYTWPGNIRELQNLLERIYLLLTELGGSIHSPETLEEYLNLRRGPAEENQLSLTVSLDRGLKAAVSDLEREIVTRCMEEHQNDAQTVMELLHIGRSTLWRKLQNQPGQPAE